MWQTGSFIKFKYFILKYSVFYMHVCLSTDFEEILSVYIGSEASVFDFQYNMLKLSKLSLKKSLSIKIDYGIC